MVQRTHRGHGKVGVARVSTKVGIIAEGPIDHALLPALLQRIALDKAELDWPLDPSDVSQQFRIRKRGHGGVLETVRALVKALDTQWFDHACFVILLDRRTRPVQDAIRRPIRGRQRFVLGVAIEEVEAWWLGDRTNTLAWAELRDADLPPDTDYASDAYRPERDRHPKRTLDGLTRLSPRLDAFYGDGNLGLAQEFAADYWTDHARLSDIASRCPKGFGRFQRAMVNAFRRAKRSGKRPF